MVFVNKKFRTQLTEVESYRNGIEVAKIFQNINNGFAYSTQTNYFYLIINGVIHSANNTNKPEKAILVNWKYYLHGKFIVRQNTNFNLDITKMIFIKKIIKNL